MSGLKDTARLLAYFAATVLFGALLAPPLYWAGQHLAASGIAPWLARFDFETFFHRALLVAAVVFLWPLLRSLEIRSRSDLQLTRNPRWLRDGIAGFLIAAVPLLCAAGVVLALRVYGMRGSVSWSGVATVALSSLMVPFIEEALFRGLIVGILLRAAGPALATIASAGMFSVVHFVKAPEGTSRSPDWASGFVSIANAFQQFGEPMLLLAGFTTLFLIGCILAHARIATRSLWLPIGLHAGWIFASGEFNKFAHRQQLALPWLGKSLLIGIVPLGVALISWAMVTAWIHYVRERDT
jgi:membrane protease YdiL (CAAX protease family)